jgi:hypothetical protein
MNSSRVLRIRVLGRGCIRSTKDPTASLMSVQFQDYVRTMQLCRVRIVAVLKVFCLVLDMLADERNLIGGAWVFRNDSLHTARLSHLEDMYRL